MTTIKIATYNIHKGLSYFKRRVVLHELRERLRELNADIVFLQEVQGEHVLHGERYHNYPEGAQHDFIADEVWPHAAYGQPALLGGAQGMKSKIQNQRNGWATTCHPLQTFASSRHT